MLDQNLCLLEVADETSAKTNLSIPCSDTRRINRKKPKMPSRKTQPRKTEPPPEPPITDNTVNIGSTWKVATRPYKSRNPQTPSNAEPKKQPKTQTATPESRNFRRGKSRNLKI
jgi:hypothetical protein